MTTPATAMPRYRDHRTDEDTAAAELVTRMAMLPASDTARPALRARAIEAWLPLARRLAHRYARRGELVDDLEQTAAIGLIKAIDGFDPGRGTDFIGYAIPTVLGEIKRYFRDRTWSVRAPRRLQDMRLAIARAQNELGNRLQRSPTVADIATYLEVSEEEILEGLETVHAYRAVSLSTPVGADTGFELGDTLGSLDHGFDLVDFAVALPPAMARLTEREQQIVVMRFFGNMTQTCIAERIGVSQMHVSRILAGALGKLRAQLTEDD